MSCLGTVLRYFHIKALIWSKTNKFFKGKKSLQNLNTNKPLIAERQAEKYFFLRKKRKEKERKGKKRKEKRKKERKRKKKKEN